ncbi:MAG: hypothetical protein ABI577_18015, partial [bacterium]
PYVKSEGSNVDGTEVSFGGSTTPTLASTQQIDVIDFVKSSSTDLEIGVQSRGADDVRVYAIWAVVQYTPPPVPDLIVTKVAKVGGAATSAVTLPSAAFTWEFTITNQGTAAASFGNGDDVLRDELPSGPTYGAPVDNAANFSCSISSDVLVCERDNSSFSIPAGGTIVITVAVTPTSAGTLDNPGAGICKVDYQSGGGNANGHVAESNESNNTCSNIVTVNAAVGPDLTATKTAKVGATTVTQVTQPSDQFDWVFEVKNVGNQPAVFAATDVWFKDTMPVGPAYSGALTVTAANPATVPTSLGSCSLASNVVTCTTGAGVAATRTLAAGQSLFLTVSVDPAASGSLANLAANCAADPASKVVETNENNNSCSNTVTVNTQQNGCAAGDVNACIALLIDHNGPQLNPANACSGIDANFVIDRSGSIDSTELAALKGGINSFASTLAGGSVFSGTAFHTTMGPQTSGYVSAATFATYINGLSTGTYTWTEGGIQGATTNTANATTNPDMMFIVTDGGPNQTDGTGSGNLNDPLDWVNAANDAITAANAARTAGFIVRAVYAGDPDSNMPFAGDAAKIAFANAVLTGLGGGSFLSGSWDQIADNLLLSAGCDPTVNKSNGVPGTIVGGKYTTVDWTITLTNSALSAKTGVVVTDASANNLISVTQVGTGGSCTPGTGAGPWTCVIPAKVSNTNGQLALKVRSTVPDYNVCVGTNGANTVTVTGGATGTGNATYTIPANPNDPSCLGKITVHKEEAGSKVTTSDTWHFALSGGTSASPITISNAGTNDFTSLAPGTYTVTETDAGAVANCSAAVAGSYIATHGTSSNPGTAGQAQGSLVVTAGATTHVYFKNDGCSGTVGISKSSSPQDNVAAGGSATWTISVTVSTNPTTAATQITDTLPAGFAINGAGVSASSFTTCPVNIGLTYVGSAAVTGCTLPAGTLPGTYTITVPVVAPANFPFANCKLYTNTAAIVGGTSATDNLTVTGCVNPGLALAKTNNLGATPLSSGGTFNWIITATISNGPTVAIATITDALPAGFAFNGTITTDSGLLTCDAPVGLNVTCHLASGAVNGAYKITIPVKAPTIASSTQCGNYTNSSAASFPAEQGAVTGSPATNTVAL